MKRQERKQKRGPILLLWVIVDGGSRERERERPFLSFPKTLLERETDKQTQRDTERERERDPAFLASLLELTIPIITI